MLKNLMNFGLQIPGTPGMFGVSASYNSKAAKEYSILISYSVGSNVDYIHLDQENCVGFAVYSMADASFTKRTHSAFIFDTASHEGGKAIWPTTTYTQENYKGNISINFA